MVPLWKRLTVPTLVFFAFSCILNYELDVELGHFGHFIFFHDSIDRSANLSVIEEEDD